MENPGGIAHEVLHACLRMDVPGYGHRSLTGVSLLDLSGLVDASGNFFGIEVDTNREKAIWLAVCRLPR